MGGLRVVSAEGTATVHTYTNTLEAFEQSYAKGYRIFEVDLQLTSDGKLAARHDWTPATFSRLGQKYPGHVPSLREFLATKVLGTYTPLDMAAVAQLMRDHPDMYIVTDTKAMYAPTVVAQFKALIAALGPDRAVLANRVIVQIYNEPMLGYVRSVYPFPNVIYSTHKVTWTPAAETRAIRFTRLSGISTMALPASRWSPRLITRIRANGIAPAVHSVNSTETAAMMNISGVRYLYSFTLDGRPTLP